eukprot:gene20281-biopygen22100
MCRLRDEGDAPYTFEHLPSATDGGLWARPPLPQPQPATRGNTALTAASRRRRRGNAPGDGGSPARRGGAVIIRGG